MDTFEDKLEKLEKLSNDIKRNDISLEDALKDFEEGIKLAREIIDSGAAEKKLAELVEESNKYAQ